MCPTGTYDGGDGGCYDNKGNYIGAENTWTAGSLPTQPPATGGAKTDDKTPKKTAYDWADMIGKYLPAIFTGVAVVTGKVAPQQQPQPQQQQGGWGYNQNNQQSKDTGALPTWAKWAIGVGGALTFIGLCWLVFRNRKSESK